MRPLRVRVEDHYVRATVTDDAIGGESDFSLHLHILFVTTIHEVAFPIHVQ